MISFTELWDYIITFLRRLFGRQVKELDLPKKTRPRTRWYHFPFRFVSTRRPGPNMPKRQTCPSCRAAAKRSSKTDTGALYICRCKTAFLVTPPRARRVNAPKLWGVQ